MCNTKTFFEILISSYLWQKASDLNLFVSTPYNILTQWVLQIFFRVFLVLMQSHLTKPQPDLVIVEAKFTEFETYIASLRLLQKFIIV